MSPLSSTRNVLQENQTSASTWERLNFLEQQEQSAMGQLDTYLSGVVNVAMNVEKGFDDVLIQEFVADKGVEAFNVLCIGLASRNPVGAFATLKSWAQGLSVGNTIRALYTESTLPASRTFLTDVSGVTWLQADTFKRYGVWMWQQELMDHIFSFLKTTSVLNANEKSVLTSQMLGNWKEAVFVNDSVEQVLLRAQEADVTLADASARAALGANMTVNTSEQNLQNFVGVADEVHMFVGRGWVDISSSLVGDLKVRNVAMQGGKTYAILANAAENNLIVIGDVHLEVSSSPSEPESSSVTNEHVSTQAETVLVNPHVIVPTAIVSVVPVSISEYQLGTSFTTQDKLIKQSAVVVKIDESENLLDEYTLWQKQVSYDMAQLDVSIADYEYKLQVYQQQLAELKVEISTLTSQVTLLQSQYNQLWRLRWKKKKQLQEQIFQLGSRKRRKEDSKRSFELGQQKYLSEQLTLETEYAQLVNKQETMISNQSIVEQNIQILETQKNILFEQWIVDIQPVVTQPVVTQPVVTIQPDIIPVVSWNPVVSWITDSNNVLSLHGYQIQKSSEGRYKVIDESGALIGNELWSGGGEIILSDQSTIIIGGDGSVFVEKYVAPVVWSDVQNIDDPDNILGVNNVKIQKNTSWIFQIVDSLNGILIWSQISATWGKVELWDGSMIVIDNVWNIVIEEVFVLTLKEQQSNQNLQTFVISEEDETYLTEDVLNILELAKNNQLKKNDIIVLQQHLIDQWVNVWFSSPTGYAGDATKQSILKMIIQHKKIDEVVDEDDGFILTTKEKVSNQNLASMIIASVDEQYLTNTVKDALQKADSNELRMADIIVLQQHLIDQWVNVWFSSPTGYAASLTQKSILKMITVNKENLELNTYFDPPSDWAILKARLYIDRGLREWMNKWINTQNRTYPKRLEDSEKFIAEWINPWDFVIDIWSGLWNTQVKYAGITVYELTQNIVIKSKASQIIATDIPQQIVRWNNLPITKYDITVEQVSLTYSTPIATILNKYNSSDASVILRAANGIDLLMNEIEALNHLIHIANTLKNNEVTYLFNKHILYKPVNSTQFSIIGELHNAWFDHKDSDGLNWKKYPNRIPYTLQSDGEAVLDGRKWE